MKLKFCELLRSFLALGLLMVALPAAGTASGSDVSAGVEAEAEAPEVSSPVELDPRVEEAERKRLEAVERAMPATVSIFVPGGGGGGSGVLISPDGYALTNFHVTSPAGAYMRCGLSDGRIYDAVIIGIDPVGDLALIRLLGRDDFPYAEMADSRRAQVGQWCMVIGNPFLLATNLQPSVSWGILSGVGRYQYPAGTLLEYADCLQTDATINPGNSGGPLFDASGRLLGIVGRASFEKRGRVNVGVGYAISIHQAKNFLGDLHSGRILDHATLGATVSTDRDAGGARISNILRSGDAYRRGLRYGHSLVEIDGRSVNTANEVQNVLATLPPQWRVKVAYLDGIERKETLVRLANLHGYDELLTKMASALPPPPPVPDAPDEKETPEGAPDGARPADPHEGETPRPERRRPRRPGGARGGSPDGDMPAEVKALFEARRGYANYHPNRVKQAELLEKLREQHPAVDEQTSDAAAAPWRIEGTTDDEAGRPVKIFVADDKFTILVGEQTIEANRTEELYDGISVGNASGLLACLHAWRGLLARGVDGYGECYYRGRVPLLGERPLRDCLIGIADELEASWIMDADSGRLEAIEVAADRDDDPAEMFITWSDASDVPPTHLELRFGTDSRLKIKIESWRAGPSEEAE